MSSVSEDPRKISIPEATFKNVTDAQFRRIECALVVGKSYTEAAFARKAKIPKLLAHAMFLKLADFKAGDLRLLVFHNVCGVTPLQAREWGNYPHGDCPRCGSERAEYTYGMVYRHDETTVFVKHAASV